MEFLSLSRRFSSARNIPSGEERGKTDVFAGYKPLSWQLNGMMQGCRNSNKKIYSNYECSFHQEKLRTACNSINHTQPLPAWMRLLPSWSWLNTTNVKLSLLVKTSENFTSGNAFLIKLPTPQEELQGKWQEYACFRRRGEVFDNGAFIKWCQLSTATRNHFV